MEIRASGITVNYGVRKALDDVAFTARAGELAAIVGPNGSGKTTLLNALTGEIRHRGRVEINGRDMARISSPDLARLRAVLPQSGSISFPFTVLELVRLGLTAGLASARIEDHDSLPMRAIEKVGLRGYEGRLVQQLSGGERQRAQLARVLVQIWEPVLDGSPRWLFLDEPVSALDIAHQLQVMQMARDYARAGGGVIAVMHDLNLTAMFADHVLLMMQGRERAAGRPAEVLNDNDLSICYGCKLRTNTKPPADGPWILPQASGWAATR
ncbi:MAG: heme ABC transporter ATP-binding protein [Pseudorhodobacter sp.]